MHVLLCSFVCQSVFTQILIKTSVQEKFLQIKLQSDIARLDISCNPKNQVNMSKLLGQCLAVFYTCLFSLFESPFHSLCLFYASCCPLNLSFSFVYSEENQISFGFRPA